MINKEQLLNLPADLYSRNYTIALCLNKIYSSQPLHLLDVGGYDGHLQWFLPDEQKVIVVDQKPRPEAENTATYLQGDARNLPFPDGSFEVVVASDLLEHVRESDRPKVLEELCRVSKDYVILGAPFQKNYTENAENIIRQQFMENAGTDHPFLIEHKSFGLPDEQKIEDFLVNKSYQFFKIGEGSLINWMLQQLCSGNKQGEQGAENLRDFNFYANQHFSELGNYREPTYRTIFCISKTKSLPQEAIQYELTTQNNFSIKTFSYLIKVAFTESRKLLNRRKKQLNLLTDEFRIIHGKNKQNNQKVEDQTKLLTEFEGRNNRLKALIEDHRQAIQFMRAVLKEKMAVLEQLEGEKEQLSMSLKNQEIFINTIQDQLSQKEKELEQQKHEGQFLKEHALKTEQILKTRNEELNLKNFELQNVQKSLSEYRQSLETIQNSRSWRLIMFYGRAKQKLIIKPWKLVKNGWGVLVNLGPKAFWERFLRKIKGTKTIGSAYNQQANLTPKQLQQISKEQENFVYNPVISIVMPVYNVEEEWLIKAIESVKKQTYTRWELCVCNDASTFPAIKPLLQKYAENDQRIKLYERTKNGGIVKASNDALRLATGAYVGLLDHDDELTLDALFEVVKALQETKYDLVYSDEDKLDLHGNFGEPFFKPDWSPDLLLSINYICHFGVYRRKIINEIGGFREGFEGSQDYDLVLRFTEKTQSIKHLSKILYHWRKVPGSAAASIDAKPYALVSAKKALEQALKRRHLEGEIQDGLWAGSYRVKRTLKDQPLVSIIIPFKDKIEILQSCLNSIFQKTTYLNYEIILVNNQSEFLETADYLKTIAGSPRMRLLNYDAPFNFAAINNFASKQAQGSILVLLNNDTEIVSPDWIETMLEQAQRPEVGAVGAKLLYPNNTVQHAGVVIGLAGIANHAFCHQPSYDHGYFGLTDLVRNYSAVTGACLMVRKDVYEKMGGLNEQDLAVAFNDVDFCLRLREQGYLIVYTPYAKLYHHESLSRGHEVAFQEIQYMQTRHQGVLKAGDPYYNPNLTRERMDFSLRAGDKVK